jgi:hypothetical protein
VISVSIGLQEGRRQAKRLHAASSFLASRIRSYAAGDDAAIPYQVGDVGEVGGSASQVRRFRQDIPQNLAETNHRFLRCLHGSFKS